MGLFPPPRVEPEALAADVSMGPGRKEHSFTREEINKLSKFPEPRSLKDSPSTATRDHLNWKKFYQMQQQSSPGALQPSLEGQFPDAHSALIEPSSNVGTMHSMGIDVFSPGKSLRRFRAMLQEKLSPEDRDFVNFLIEELEKLPKDEYEEYEDIDDYKMQHPISTRPELSISTQQYTSASGNLGFQEEENPKMARLTKKPLKLTKSLHNLKHDNLFNVREASAVADRRLEEEKDLAALRRLSSGEYFTDNTYFNHLGTEVSPLLYSDDDLLSDQKVDVKTLGEQTKNLQVAEVKTPGEQTKNLHKAEVKPLSANPESLQTPKVKADDTDLIDLHTPELKTPDITQTNLRKAELKTNEDLYGEELHDLEHDSVHTQKSKDRNAEYFVSGIREHDKSIQKSKKKGSAVHLLSKQKYVSSEDFRRMNDSVFPIPKSESSMERVKADARIYERTRAAARALPAMKQIEMQRNNVNVPDSAPLKPPIPQRNMARVQGINLNAPEGAKGWKPLDSTKNLLSIEPKSANTCAPAKEENSPALTKNATHAQRSNTNTFGWTQAERDTLHSSQMAEQRHNTEHYRHQLYQDNSAAYGIGAYQPPAHVTQSPMRRGMDPEAPVGRHVPAPTIRKMKSEGFALARNDASVVRHRVARNPPPEAIQFGQVVGQGTTAVPPRRRVVFAAESSAETSSGGGPVPRGAAKSEGKSSRAVNSDSGSISVAPLRSAMRFPPPVHGGSRRLLMPDNGRVELADHSFAYLQQRPEDEYQNLFASSAGARSRGS
ncbi:hypothetical protein MMC26_000415 [Xylographa opegraphella]|nr:hypothetical protein [Xylographa opegraphella]